MINIFIGSFVTAGLFLLVNFTRKRKISVFWWQWVLTIIGFIYLTFVLEVIAGFLSEGAVRAAIVNGFIFGIIAVVWGVLLSRFVFVRSNKQGK